jgi:urease alpha subunit
VQMAGVGAHDVLDTVIVNALIVDYTGIYKVRLSSVILSKT